MRDCISVRYFPGLECLKPDTLVSGLRINQTDQSTRTRHNQDKQHNQQNQLTIHSLQKIYYRFATFATFIFKGDWWNLLELCPSTPKYLTPPMLSSVYSPLTFANYPVELHTARWDRGYLSMSQVIIDVHSWCASSMTLRECYRPLSFTCE